MEKQLAVESYIGFNGNVRNNLILVKREKEIDKKVYRERLKRIEDEETLENEKKKKLKTVYNLKHIDVNHNYYALKREELRHDFFMIYAIGTNIIKEDIVNNERTIFKSDENKIVKLYVDANQKYICCCKESKLMSNIYIYDFENKNKTIVLALHKFKTADLSISKDGMYLLSSGGEDDKQLILTQIDNQKFIYKSSSEYPYTNVSFFHQSNNFIIAKLNSIKICYYDFSKKLMSEEEVNTSIYKRQFLCLELKENDEYAFLGTTTGAHEASIDKQKRLNVHVFLIFHCVYKNKSGDVLVVNIKSKVLEKIIPESYLFSNGINVVKILGDDTVLTGLSEMGEKMSVIYHRGDGYVSLVNVAEKKIVKKTKLYGSINSIEMRNEKTLYISVRENIIYVMDMVTSVYYVLLLMHNDYISDLCFPVNYNYVMYTCSYNSVMAWQFYDKKVIYLRNIDKGRFIYYDHKYLCIPTDKKKKLCKIKEMEIEQNALMENKNNNIDKLEKINKNLTCYSVNISEDGKYLALSVHNNIYLFTPKYMKVITVILNVHYDYCNKFIFYNDYDLITAGNHGDIKLWKFKMNKYINVNTINYHSSAINQIVLYNRIYLCSCSEDGLVTIYNIEENVIVKKIIDLNSTRYKQICLNKQYDILLCCGNNNVFMYYDLVKNDISKHFYYSPSHNVLSVDMDPKGKYFITGSDDCKLRLYEFKSCTCLYIGDAHNDAINKCAFTFDNHFIVSASKDESIIYWKVPPETKESD
ncbi:WD repeat-containing protein 16, putative (WDR16) [Plasmodium ovale curtisi]|uniref:Cilia- and flagella-associated protein 52 n=1 Tax=Plasmodium ovale curtisi TaxID=864141 RepID=A0A1A8WVZ2_PLAOA|nr:WD repeat-containing protein 16, putative (WDR16) [Plasmodium ovale curtisi]SBS96043.1 WD repeat-containing protein 16, putative (WDR16) [Plasmodium ovale curtisi]